MRLRMNELKELLNSADMYTKQWPVYEELNAIKWQGRREKFKEAHAYELRMFYMAKRKLKAHFTPDGKLPISKWKQESAKLRKDNEAAYAEYKVLHGDLMKLLQMQNCVDTAVRQLEQTEQERAKKRQHEQER